MCQKDEIHFSDIFKHYDGGFDPENPCVQRLLLVTLSNIGDAIMSTPVLEAMHQHAPQALIDIVCDPRSADLFVHCPYRGDLIVRDKQAGWLGAWRVLQQCRKQHYVLAVDLKTDVLLFLLRASRRLGKLPTWRRADDMHSVSQHVAALRPLLGTHMPMPLKLWHSDKEMVQVQALLPAHRGQRRLVLGLGANSPHKLWPVALFAALAEALRDRFGEVVLLGDARDAPLAQQFIACYSGQAVSVCGQLNLSASYAALRTADFYIGNDSGLGHMAAAAGVPSFTIFGPGNPQRYSPWSAVAGYYQAPTQQIGDVTVAQVLSVLRPQLEGLFEADTRACG